MTTGLEDLDASTRKFRLKYEQDCLFSANTGFLSDRLDIALGGLKFMLHCQVRESERLNKQIKLILERSPNVTTDLLSSRLGIKFFLGAACAGGGRTRCKWSEYKPVAQKLQNECLSAWDSDLMRIISSKPDRFSPPVVGSTVDAANNAGQAAVDCVSVTEMTNEVINKEYVKAKPHLRTSGGGKGIRHPWAVCYNMKLSKLMSSLWGENEQHNKQFLDIPVICFGSRKPTETRSSFTAYMAVEKVRTCQRMVACDFDTKSNKLRVLIPLRFSSSTDLIASHFSDVKAGVAVGIFAVKLESLGDRSTHSFIVGNSIGIKKMLQLKPPSAEMEVTLGELNRQDKKETPEELLPAPSPSPVSKPSSTSLTTPPEHSSSSSSSSSIPASKPDDGDADLMEGLNLLAKEELQRLQREQQQSTVSKTTKTTKAGVQQEHAGTDAVKSSELLDQHEAREMLSRAISDSRHLPDDLELDEELITEETSKEIGENVISAVESALVGKLFQNGQVPTIAAVNELMEAGLDI